MPEPALAFPSQEERVLQTREGELFGKVPLPVQPSALKSPVKDVS